MLDWGNRQSICDFFLYLGENPKCRYRWIVRRGCVLCNPHMYDDGLSEHHGHVTKTMSLECMTKKKV